MIPISKKDNIYEEYEELIGRERMGETEYVCGRLRKKFDLTKLLNGFEPYENRQKQSSEDRSVNLNVQFNPNINVAVKNDISVNINIKNENIAHFNNMLDTLLKEGLPILKDEQEQEKFAREIETVKRAAEEIKVENDDKRAKNSSAMQRLGGFINKLSDVNTRTGKVISALESGVDNARKLAGYYNKIAQWCGMPSITDIFMK